MERSRVEHAEANRDRPIRVQATAWAHRVRMGAEIMEKRRTALKQGLKPRDLTLHELELVREALEAELLTLKH